MLAKLRRRHPSHAALVAYAALFIALGGTSVAAISLERGSVKGKHIARNAVTSAKVKNSSLLARDFRRGQLPRGGRGEPGPPGPIGPTGPLGPTFGGITGDVRTPPSLEGSSAVGLGGGSIDVPRDGKLLVFARDVKSAASCAGNPCSVHVGLYVDERPVPGSGEVFGPGNNQAVPVPPPDLFGFISVSSGTHEIQYYAVNPDGGVGVSADDGQGAVVGAVLLGG
ncbi:MAG TPA: hypothetical protein VHG69_07525 [Thermoleophilaceae bacterium]|nr:hypothetical protein [Thermoleophilaceae bacterium]